MPLRLIPPRPGKTPYFAVRGTYLGRYVDRSTKARKRGIAGKIMRAWERAIERDQYAGPGEPTFASAALAYMNAGGERTYLTPLLDHFEATPLKQIGQGEIERAAAALYPAASNATRNRQVYTPCSAVLRHGGRELRLRRPKGAQGRALTGWLWPEQAFALLEQCGRLDAEFGILCTMLLYTGERLSEPLKLTCDDVRLAERFAFLPDSKNGEPRPIFLPPVVVAALADHPRGLDRGTARLFRFHKGGHLYALLTAAAFKAGVTLPDRQKFHLFCHTWATWMRRYGGVDTRGLVGTGRWKNRKSVDRYEHVVAGEEAARAALLPTPGKIRGNRRSRRASV